MGSPTLRMSNALISLLHMQALTTIVATIVAARLHICHHRDEHCSIPQGSSLHGQALVEPVLRRLHAKEAFKNAHL
jgi:hypothetical protein